MKPSKKTNKSDELRKRAEALLRKTPSRQSRWSAGDASKLIHELQVHQAELEMQNEELLRAQAELESSWQRYAKLYDFAPVGYVTLNEEGTILEANLTAAGLLCVNRSDLISKPFHRFISYDSQDAFYLHSREVFSAQTRQRCELLLRRPDDTTFDAELETVAVVGEGDERRCFLILSDITARKGAEAEVREEAECLAKIIAAQDEISTGEGDLELQLNFLVRQMQELTRADGAALEQLEGDDLVYRLTSGIAARQAGIRLGRSSSLSGQCVREGRILSCEDAETDPRVEGAACRKVGLRSMLVMPLSAGGNEIKAVIKVLSARTRAFGSRETRIFRLLGGVFIAAMHQAARRKSEAELRESRTRLAWVLDKTGTGTWLNELPLAQLNWDEQTRRLFFVPPGAEATFELFWSRLHPDDRDPTRVAVEEALRNHSLYSIEHRAVHPETGEVRWIRSMGQAIYAADETPLRFDGINYDITERKQSELALAESRARLAGIVESAMDGIISIDQSQHIVMINGAAEKLFGYDAGALLGQPLSKLIPERLRSAHEQHVKNFGEAGVTNRRMGALSTIFGLKASGEEFPIEASISQVEAGGKKLFTVILRDITERRWVEIRRKLQFETNRALAKAGSLVEVGAAILQVACESLNWTFGEIWEKSPDGKVMQFSVFWHRPSMTLKSFVRATRAITFTKGIGLPGKVWTTGRPVWIEDVSKDPSLLRREVAARNGLHSAFAYPLLMGAEVMGVVAFFTQNAIRETPRDLMQLFAAIGAQIAQFMERKRTENALEAERQRNVEALKARASQQSAISTLAQYALSDVGLDSVLDKAVMLVGEVLGVELCKVLELQPDGASMLMRAGIGWKGGSVGRANVPSGPESQAGFTLLAKKPVIVEDLRTETRFHNPRLLLDHGVVSGISVIIHGRARPYGVLGAHTKRLRRFTGDDLHFLQSIANVLAASIERGISRRSCWRSAIASSNGSGRIFTTGCARCLPRCA